MAITFTNLGASAAPDINSSADAASYTGSSVTPPTAGMVVGYILGARTAGPTTPTVSGWGVTWAQIGSTLSMAAGERSLSLFAADLTGATTGAITVDFGGVTQIGCCASFFQVEGVDLSGGVAAAFVQVKTATASTGTSGTVALDPAGNAANRPIAGWFHSTSEATTHRTDWTEMDDILGTSPSRALETQCREDAFETTASASWATSSFRGVIAAELKATLVTTPTAPSDLVATAAGTDEIDLVWVDNASNETGFELERSLDGSTGWTQIATPAADAESYTDTGLDQDTEYFYRIRAVNAEGNSAYSATASDTTDALAPSLITNVELQRLYVHSPAIVFTARVNMPSVTYPVQDITYDNVTLGAYTDLAPDMFFTIGSTIGADDYGRGRLRAMPTVTTLKVGRASQGTNDGELDVVDNAHITVYDDYRVHAKIPYITPAGTMYKDSDMPVLDRTTTPPPVANIGPGWAGTIDDVTGLVTVFFDDDQSFAVADGATITGYNWDVKDGSFTLGSVSTDSGVFATFPAGFRWVALTVTDSNGKTHSARCPVFARDPEDDATVQSWQIERHTRSIKGASISFRILEDLPRSTYPDGALVMCWEDNDLEPQSRAHMTFIGWHQSDRVTERATETALLSDTILECVDVAGRLDALPGFPQTIEDDATRDEDVNPDITWAFMTTPNIDKYIHYLLQWHSTALDLADYFPSGTGDDYPFIIFQSDGQTLYDQVNRKANQIVPDHNFTCNRRGQLRVIVDPMLQNEADRTATVQGGFLEEWWSGLDFTYQRPPRVHRLYASAVLTGTAEPIGTVFSVAPGTAPSQGTNEATHGEQLAQSQADLNDVTGHRYARMNARHGMITVTAASGNDQDIDPADMTWVELFTSADTAPQRGMALGNTTRCLPHEVSIDYRYTETGVTQETRVTLEVETVGRPALTEEREGALPVGDVPDLPLVTIPPGFGLEDGVQMVAGVDLDGYIYRTTDFQTPSGSGGPTWDRVDTGITETIYSFVVDPFSPGYIDGVGSIDGWIATETDIYRVEDMFAVTPTVTSVHTFATTATAASYHWRSIQASFGAYFAAGVNPWLLCISYYKDSSGHTGTWALRSLDGGVTWETETQVSAFYNSGSPTRFNPIGVYTSPKTPGLAYTAAYTETGNPALTDGYVSTDWGETWTAVSTGSADDPAEPLPLWAIIDATGGEIVGAELGASVEHVIAAVAGGSVSLANSGNFHIVVAPPAAAVRIVVEAFYENTVTVTSDAFTSFSTTYGVAEPIGAPAATEDLTYVSPPGTGGVTAQFFTVEWTRSGSATDWEGNREQFEASPPTSGNAYRRFVMAVDASKVGSSSVCTNELFHQATVVEIELENGHIYTPPATASGMIQPIHAQAGSIHLPWPDNDAENIAYYGSLDKTGNRLFRLKRALGDAITDISPAGTFGVNRYGFAVRTHDSNRQYVLASVIGNDSSSSADDDTHAVYISDDYGDTWTNIVTAVADTSAPDDRPAFEAAFGGDSEQVVFVWGPASDIRYSADFGATLDSRAGNLGTLGATGFIGIAGGPTG